MKKTTITYILFLIISWSLLIYKLWPAITEHRGLSPAPGFAFMFLVVLMILAATVPPALYKLWKVMRGEESFFQHDYNLGENAGKRAVIRLLIGLVLITAAYSLPVVISNEIFTQILALGGLVGFILVIDGVVKFLLSRFKK